MFWYDHDVSGWGWVGMTIGRVAFWGVVITAIVLLVRGVDPQRTADGRSPAREP